ncbi:MAG TPA: VPA1262 family N-terminal domain-containing protein [Methylocella sp.]|jgi:hypothetical protein
MDNTVAQDTPLSLLTREGVIGFYTDIEVTEIVAFRVGIGQPLNVFTLLVAEERGDGAAFAEGFLNSKRIRVPTLKQWSFGIFRYRRPVGDVIALLDGKPSVDTWSLSGNCVEIGRLLASGPFVVPPDAATELPWNRVLKNNFWNGSYAFDWHDAEKAALADLILQPKALQELTERIRQHVPIGLARLSDRLGNIVLQLPITVLMAQFSLLRDGTGMQVEIAWHPKANPRLLSAQTTRFYDGVLGAFATTPITSGTRVLELRDGPGEYVSLLRDDANRVILATTAPTSFISVISLNLQVGDPEPRVFEAGRGETRKPQRVTVCTTMPSQVGELKDAHLGEWSLQRIYRDEVAGLTARRQFVQYRPTGTIRDEERTKAIADLRHLINTYGEGGAWLWDPYLDADDILETLFFCRFAGAELRALTAMRVPVQSEEGGGKDHFLTKQRETFERAGGNLRGLRLEYRGRNGAQGWEFHDRFLIFPKTNEGPLAWSLGASVNSVGKQHHILQKVGDGQLIADAFLDLWDALDRPEHLIWRHP